MKITKSKYVEFCMCPRKAWLNLFNPLPPKSSSAGVEGSKIGYLARNYFGDNVVVDVDKFNPVLTSGLYAEYPLRKDDLECYVDILQINDDGSIDIYETKGVNQYSNSQNSDESTEVSKIKPQFLEDVSFQYYVAIKMGFKVNTVNLLVLNKEYVYDGIKMDYQQLFKAVNVSDQVIAHISIVEEKINSYRALSKENEVHCKLTGYCNKYEGCPYLELCKKSKNLPDKQSVYDLYDCPKKTDYIENKILTFQDLVKTPYFEKLTMYNQRMVMYSLLGIKEPYVNKDALKKFLNKFKSSILFFDFETVQYPIPVFANSRPYQQIPFQYSLHVLKDSDCDYEEVVNPSNNLYFLGDGVKDPREELIIKMLKDLGTKGKIVAYNDSFEKARIKELARDFPKYEKKLNNLLSRFVDLCDVFLTKEPDGYKDKKLTEQFITTSIVYHPDMGNSCSIKHVLPAFFPNNPEFDYSKLEQVHKGDEASASYQILKTLSLEEQHTLRENMLKYCCLDTKAMVALYFKLKELCEH